MDGQNVINEIAFSQSVINIGSDSGNDIVLRGAKVADFHAMLNYAGSTWHLIPLDPGYPVLLNGRGIGPEGSTLPTGSVLSIGDYRLTVSVNGMNADILVAQTAPLPGDVKEAGTPEETSGKNILLTITAPGTYEVETGNTVEYELTVTNAGPLVANMQIQLQGVPSAWVQIIPPVLNLNEARKGTFQVRISPPRDPSSEAGEYHLHFVAISPNYPGETATADTSLMVLPFRQFLLNGPNPRRLNLKRTHREDYSDVVILNQSNSETTYMVRSFDDGNELNYAYKLENDSLVQGQDTITVPAGESQRVPVQVGARKAPVFGFIDRVHHYYTSVTPADDPTSAQSVVGEVHVRPLINGLWLLLFILLILLLNLFIFQPYIYQFSSISGKLTEVIIAGESVTVDWRTSHFASNVTLTEGTGGNPVTVEQSGSMVLTPKVSTTYRLRAANLLSRLIGLTYEKELNVLLIPARPSIDLFSTDIKEAYFEQPVNLKWAVGENAETAFMVINKQRTDLAKENYSGSQENKFNSDTLLWMRAQNQSGYETKSLFVNVDPDKINLNRFTAWVRPNGIAVPSDNDVRRTTRWGSLANLYGTVPTPQTLRPANVNPMPAPQSNVLEIPDNYGTAPYTGSVSPEQQLLSGSDNGLNPSAAELLVSPSLVSTPAAPATAVPVIQAPMRTPVASATAPASSPERAVNREFSIKLAEVIEDPMSESGYRTIWYFDNYVLQKGEQVLIDWEVSGVPNVKIENLSADPVGASGSDFVYPEKNTNYTLEAEIGSLKKNFTLPLLVAGDADNGQGSGLNCELKANATTLTVPGSVMLTWSGGGSNRVQLISSAKAESENADAEKKKEAEAKEKGEPYTKPTNAPLEGGIIGDWLQPAGFMRVNVDKQTTFVLNAYDGNGNVICTKSAEVKYTGGNDKLDLKMKISKIADMDDNETKTFYVGQTAQFTVAFSDFEKGKDPTGSVMITDGDSTCSVTLPKDTCSMVLKHEGTRKITAVYSGDNTYNKLTATSSVKVINKRSIQLDITKVSDDFPDLGGVSQPYYVVGQDIFYTVNLSKHLKGRIPTGTIKISDGTGSCTVTWPDQKTCSIKAAKAGENIRVTAEYSGDEVYKPATAETTVEVLTKRPITFKITKVTDAEGVESKYYKLGQKYRVYTELSDTAPELEPTGTIMITDGLSTCTVTLPDNACDLEAKKLGDLTVKAVYSGDANYVTKVAETTINVTNKIPTKLKIEDDPILHSNKSATTDLISILTWESEPENKRKPTGTIKFTTRNGSTSDPKQPHDKDAITGTCIIDLNSSPEKLSCENETFDLDKSKDKTYIATIMKMLLSDSEADRIKAEYSGDIYYLPSESTVVLFKIIGGTELALEDGKKYSDNRIDITTVLTLAEEVDPGDKPTGTITFTSGGATCVLNLKTEKFENCSGALADPVEIGPDNKSVTLTITDMIMQGTPGDSISAKFEKDPLYNDSISPAFNFDGKIDTEIKLLVATKDPDNKINIDKVLLTWLKEPVSGEKPAGTVTFTSGGSTCIIRLNADEPKFETCSGIVSYLSEEVLNELHNQGELDDLDKATGLRIEEMVMNGTPGDSIYAKYNGDTLFNESTSAALEFNKNPIKISVEKIMDKSGVEQPYFAVGQKVIVEVKLGDDDLIVEPTGTVTVSVGTASCTLTYENTHQCEMTLPETAGELDLKANYPGDNYYLSAATDTMVIEVRKKQDIILEVVKITDMEGNEQSEYFINEQIIAEIELSGYDPAINPSGEVTVVSESGTCTITLPGTSCSLKAAPYAGNHYLQAAYSGDDYYNKKNNVLSDMYKVVDRHKVNFTINQVTNDEDIKQEPPHYYVYDPVNHTGQKIHVYAVPFYTDDDQDRFDLNGKVTIVNPKTSESCTYTAPLAQFCELTLGPQTGELLLKARYEDNPNYVSRDAEFTIHVENRIKTEPIIQNAHKMLKDNLLAEIQLEFVYDRTLVTQYGVGPDIDNTHSTPEDGTITFVFSDDDGSETQCVFDLHTDTFVSDCGTFVSKESNTDSVTYYFTDVMTNNDAVNGIKAIYNGNRFFNNSTYGPEPIGVEDQGLTELTVSKAVKLGERYAFFDASMTYDTAVTAKYGKRPADGIGKLTLTPIGGSSPTCEYDFTDGSVNSSCSTLTVVPNWDTDGTVTFEIGGMPIMDAVTAVKIRYGSDQYFMWDEQTPALTVEDLPEININYAVRPGGNTGEVGFTVSGIGEMAEKYNVFERLGATVSDDGLAWQTPVYTFDLPGTCTIDGCGGTVSETGEGVYKLENWSVSSSDNYFTGAVKHVQLTLQSTKYGNLNHIADIPKDQDQFGLDTKLTMFDVLYAHGYDFLETNLTYDNETLSSYVPTGKIKVTFLNADGNPYPTQTSDYEFTVSAPVSAGLIDDIATNIRMEWGAHYTAYAEYLGNDIFRYCKSETVTITQEDDPTLSITNAMKKKDSSDGMNYLYALFKISNLGTLWDKYGIIDGYELRNYPITSRIIKYPAVDQRPGAMVIQPAGYQNDGTVTETETGTFLVKGLKLGIGAGVDSGTDLQVSLTTPYSTLIVSGITTYKEYSTIRTSRTLTGSHKFLVQDTHIFLTSTLHILDNEAKELYGIEPSGTVTYKAGDSTCTFTFPDGAIEATYKVKYGNCTVSVEPSYTAAGKKEFTIKVLDWHNVSSTTASVEMTYSGDGIHDSCSIPAYLVPSTPAVTINSAIKTSPTTASVMFTIDNYFDVNTYKEFLVYDYIQIGLSGSGGSISKLVKIPSDGDSEIIGLEETINGLLRRNGNVFEIQDLEIKHSDYTNIFSTFHAGLASYETYNGTGLVIDVEKNFTISGFGTSLGSPASSGSGSPVSLSLELEP